MHQQQKFIFNKNQFNPYQQQKNYNFNQQQPQTTPIDENTLIDSLKYVTEKYPNLVNINQSYYGLSQTVKNQFNPRFFVIKSFTEEDIHKVYTS